ncbi:glycosyltransferase [Frondihabitans australicus]|uniref:Glycosyltransferase involved in cell wall biosynthesis n=1 Tax=Frondihabitans australicus TaxID=386892 RepID=A0A495ICA1_9MICO|nr:glycosyltransferase [Frondihabitans australicus]RKR73549.1 glycosyltransferase involved in cell wall biosynthesis [Frondihabitans australicus]
MRSIVVSKFVPWPPNSGDKRRTLAIARALKDVGEVVICGFAADGEDVAGLASQGFEVRAVPLRRGILKTLVGLVHGQSLSGARFWDADLAEAVASATGDPFDTIVVVHPQLQMYLPKGAWSRAVIDMQNVESALAARVAATRRGVARALYAIDSIALRRLERRAGRARLVTAVSEGDKRELVTAIHADNVLVVPNAWDSATPLPPTVDPVVSFVALLSWGPNVAAAVWFATNVWPRVIEAVPEARLHLVGREPSAEVRGLASESVVVTGTVDRLEPWYEASAISVAPLLAGGGSRLKILESLAFGRPVVATAIGVEGLEDLIGDGVVVADDVEGMAREIITLLRDPALAQRIGEAGVEAVDSRHSWRSATEPLLAAVASSTAVGSTP